MEEDAMPKRPWTVTTAFYLLCFSVGLWWTFFMSVRSEDVISGSPLALGSVGLYLTQALVVYRNYAAVLPF